VCGDERHDFEHCYSATCDAHLSLPSLAFLDEALSDIKIQNAQRPGCSLHGQPPGVIEVVRNIEVIFIIIVLDVDTLVRIVKETFKTKKRVVKEKKWIEKTM
jgi:hypothetical protein